MITVNRRFYYFNFARWMVIATVLAGRSVSSNAGGHDITSIDLQPQRSSSPQRLQTVDNWTKPGCHKVGHTRLISIPNCVEFHISTNACRGYCESWTVPSPLDTVKTNPHQPITSIGECCNIMDTEDVEISVLCLDGTKDLIFKSATSCSCYHCKKD